MKKLIIQQKENLLQRQAFLVDVFKSDPEGYLTAIREFRQNHNYHDGTDNINYNAYCMSDLQEFLQVLVNIQQLDSFLDSERRENNLAKVTSMKVAA